MERIDIGCCVRVINPPRRCPAKHNSVHMVKGVHYVQLESGSGIALSLHGVRKLVDARFCFAEKANG